ncbi:MAG: hypothetical protein IIB59_05215 [Planctomycetes bacterium]|nr:hypothetical protein [Planctomycetota bacterium]
MTAFKRTERYIFEGMLILVTLGLTLLLFRMGGYKMVVLNLFFLPVVLSGYFLGRTSAGTLALLSVLFATIVTTLGAGGLAAYNTPIMVGLALTVWGATLGLTAILVGTLCDERAKTIEELHAAYVGVVEVLSRYLQSANPKVRAQSLRASELCHSVATELRLPRKQVDDERVASMLHDLGNVEITTQLLTKAVGTLEADPSKTNTYTFSGMELVHSLGSVLSGAVPLLLNQDDAARECFLDEDTVEAREIPVGAHILRAVRAYEALVAGDTEPSNSPEAALQDLRKDIAAGYDSEVLDALERHVERSTRSGSPRQPVMA